MLKLSTNLRDCLRTPSFPGNLPKTVFSKDTHSVRIGCAALFVLACAALAACVDDGGRLSLDEGVKCATGGFSGHTGTFSLGENAIAYSYESPNGRARVLVVFDAGRRPVRTVFESAPHGSHPELMDAALAIKDCVAYGAKRGESDKGGATSMMGK